MRRVPSLGLLIALAAVSACGVRTELKPKVGHSLPPAPYGRSDRPTADALLTPTPQAAPERSVELRKRSEERQDDPFDLPPEEAPLPPGAARVATPPPAGPCQAPPATGVEAHPTACRGAKPERGG